MVFCRLKALKTLNGLRMSATTGTRKLTTVLCACPIHAIFTTMSILELQQDLS